ncbi:MAG: 4'-phosphopantetheinyl transferase family protein [Sporichthyaceae bacterium]
MSAPPQVQVWWARADAVTPRASALLDADERARCARLRSAADARRFRTAHVLARVVLGITTGADPAQLRFAFRCAACEGSHGKPALPGGPEFSLSHAGTLVVLALAPVAVGVDLEPMTALDRPGAADELSEVALCARERVAVRALPGAEQAAAVLSAWTRKEAVLKLTGHGLAVNPADLELSGPGVRPPRVLAAPAAMNLGEVAIADLRISSQASGDPPVHVGAVAVRGLDLTLSLWCADEFLSSY